MQDALKAVTSQPPGPQIGGVPLAEIADCNGLRLRRVARMVTALYDTRLRTLGLTSQQFSLLANIHGAMLAGRALSMSALADLTGLDPTTLTRTLLPLKAAGWVTNARAQDDRRRKHIELTASGQAILAEGARQWLAASKTLQDRLGQSLNGDIKLALDTAIGRLDIDGSSTVIPATADGLTGLRQAVD
jgi:hypothetical protein